MTDSIKKIKICKNHLPEFYEALKKGDIKKVEKIEHELTHEEECVACAYIFKAKGTTREALEQYLNKEGVLDDVSPISGSKTNLDHFIYWTFRSSIIFFSFICVYFLEALFRIIFIKGKIFDVGLVEIIAIFVVTILFFLYIDDKLLD